MVTARHHGAAPIEIYQPDFGRVFYCTALADRSRPRWGATAGRAGKDAFPRTAGPAVLALPRVGFERSSRGNNT